MELKVYEDHEAQSAAAAAMIIECIKKKPDALISLATGDSPKLTYKLLTERADKEKVDFSNCRFVALDEWVGIPPDNPGSCHHFLHTYLFQPLGIAPAQVHLFDGMTANEEADCERMNAVISDNGPVDLMLVGVGMNGHVGFNEPGSALNAMAHVSVLDEITKSVSKKYFLDEPFISKGMTLGLKQVMEANTLLMLANGKKKAPVIKKLLGEEISTSFPASVMRLRANSILMIDSEAASELETTGV